MHTKLTLRLDQELIEFAKKHAQQTGQSVSKMVSDFFSGIKAQQKKRDWREDLGPITKSLVGTLKGAKVTPKDYVRYLEERYK